MSRSRRARALRATAAAITATALVVLGVALVPSPVAATQSSCNLFERIVHHCGALARQVAEPVTPTPLAPDPGACGGEDPVKSDGSAWQCSFDEEFNGTALNRDIWTVQTTAGGGFHSGQECFVDNSQNVSVSNGALDLTVLRAAAPFTCTTPGGGYTTQYTSGSVYSKYFDQIYGRFEVRARFAEGGGKPGLQGALWLYPRLAKYTSAGGPSEIDIAEAYSLYPNYVMPTVHTRGGGTHNCTVTDYGADFHTYAVEWSPQAAVFYYDGVPCFRVAPNFLGVPLNSLRTTTPFFVALTQALGISRNVNNADTPLPATLQVDYVRAWN